ncbi:MAG TPA: hypothetical protein PLL78_05525 [Fimbriimonadaceae bacterium]|nr:hypothetical protein [Fimbriimonadaceae bacterium]HRJ96127.1 hypothetical protein [Fimbriimonadaceae bacterium]
MDEAPNEAPVGPAEKPKGLSTPAKIAIAGAVVLLAFLIQSWLGGLRTEAARREMLGRTADALAAASEPLLLDLDAPRRASAYATRIAQAGRFDQVTIADRDGRIIGSTNRTLEGRTETDLQNPPKEAKVVAEGNRLRATRAILLGSNNVIGGIRIEVAR